MPSDDEGWVQMPVEWLWQLVGIVVGGSLAMLIRVARSHKRKTPH